MFRECANTPNVCTSAQSGLQLWGQEKLMWLCLELAVLAPRLQDYMGFKNERYTARSVCMSVRPSIHEENKWEYSVKRLYDVQYFFLQSSKSGKILDLEKYFLESAATEQNQRNKSLSQQLLHCLSTWFTDLLAATVSKSPLCQKEKKLPYRQDNVNSAGDKSVLFWTLLVILFLNSVFMFVTTAIWLDYCLCPGQTGTGLLPTYQYLLFENVIGPFSPVDLWHHWLQLWGGSNLDGINRSLSIQSSGFTVFSQSYHAYLFTSYLNSRSGFCSDPPALLVCGWTTIQQGFHESWDFSQANMFTSTFRVNF